MTTKTLNPNGMRLRDVPMQRLQITPVWNSDEPRNRLMLTGHHRKVFALIGRYMKAGFAVDYRERQELNGAIYADVDITP